MYNIKTIHEKYKLTIDDEQSICFDYKQGIKTKDINIKYGVSPRRIFRILRNNNIRVKSQRLSSNEIDTIINDIVEGHTVKSVCQKMNISFTCIHKYLNENNILVPPRGQFQRIYTINDDFLHTVDTHEKAQFLGLLFSDGSVDSTNKLVRISLQIADKEYLDQWRLIIGSNKPLVVLESRKHFDKKNNKYYHSTGVAILDITGKNFYSNVVKCGVIPRKSFLNIELPDQTIINKQYYNSLLLGLFEGDGCITWTKKTKSAFCLNFSIGEKICYNILQIIDAELNIKGSYRKASGCGVAYFNKIKDIITIIHWMYSGSSSIKMLRKYDKCQEALQIFKAKGYDITNPYLSVES